MRTNYFLKNIWRRTVNKISIAIDGPASAGKSTIAKKIAEKLGLIYLDTGAMYRSLTYAAVKNEVSFEDEEALVSLLDTCNISFKMENGVQKVSLNNEDVTEYIRNIKVTNHVSEVSSHVAVRKEMVSRQQEIAREGGIVMDGRDIGTVVMPHANLKIFLNASAEERASRRYQELRSNGVKVSLQQLTEDMKARDHYDTHRVASPLKKAEDAIELNTTNMNIDEVINKMLSLVNKLKEG